MPGAVVRVAVGGAYDERWRVDNKILTSPVAAGRLNQPQIQPRTLLGKES